MAIYTKKGDKGETSLFDKESRQNIRISKDSLRIRAIGALDEVNSYLGLCLSLSEDKKISKFLTNIQGNLFKVGAILAGAKLRFSTSKTLVLEKEMNRMEETLPTLKNFILPGGNVLAANLQVARTITRRAEREIVALSEVERVRPEILAYLNRLSDLLFMLARKVNFESKVKEKVWKSR
jgi:cob(I)alamin adenosyltransferase